MNFLKFHASRVSKLSNKSKKFIFLYVLLLLAWGYSWIVAKQALLYIEPFQFVAIRYIGGACFLFGILLISKRSLKPVDFRITCIIGICQIAGFQGLTQLALVHSDAGSVTLIGYTMPFWLIVFNYFVFREKVSRRTLIYVCLIIIGLLIFSQFGFSSVDMTAVGLAIIAAMLWAIGTLLSRKLFLKWHELDLVNFTAWQMLTGSAALSVFLLLSGTSLRISWSAEFIYYLIYGVFVAAGGAWMLWFYLLKRLPLNLISAASVLIPVVAIVLGNIILREKLNSLQYAGAFLILAGIGGIMKLQGQKR